MPLASTEGMFPIGMMQCSSVTLGSTQDFARWLTLPRVLYVCTVLLAARLRSNDVRPAAQLPAEMIAARRSNAPTATHGCSAFSCRSTPLRRLRALTLHLGRSSSLATATHGSAGTSRARCRSPRPTHQHAAKITAAPAHTCGRTASPKNTQPKSAAHGNAVNSSTPSACASAAA